MKLTYKNEYGTLELFGCGSEHGFHITGIEGLGLSQREYTSVTYTGEDGQSTVSSRFLPRCITIGADISSPDAAADMRNALIIMRHEGYLYIEDGDYKRRIYCSGSEMPDVKIQKRGQIASFALQLLADDPYFEDETDTVTALYERTKNLSTSFTLPCEFGTTKLGADVTVEGDTAVEPIFKIYFPTALDSEETVSITNELTGKAFLMTYAPKAKEEITVDIRERTVTGSVGGDLIGFVSDDTFLGELKLSCGVNPIMVSTGNIASNVTVECIYNNKYIGAVIV